jgi:hypothetical protein
MMAAWGVDTACACDAPLASLPDLAQHGTMLVLDHARASSRKS